MIAARLRKCLVAISALSLQMVPALHAQNPVLVPAGTVFLVRTESPLESATAQINDAFETRVVEAVSINGYTVIPAATRVQGTVTYAQKASRQRSGVMQVAFNRIVLPDGRAYAIAAKLTSTDSTERRQIESRADSRVVLVGERGGLGAAIAGAGSSNSPAAGILGALGNMLSEGLDVRVPAGTQFAVQLERSVSLPGRAETGNDPFTMYTSVERIRAAQRALNQLAYYRGPLTGQFDNATRRALFEFQLDNQITATGNLDRRTAAALKILTPGADTQGGTSGTVLSAVDAAALRRNAQALEARQRRDVGLSDEGKIISAREPADTDVNLLFALSAFADNASLYEQFARGSADSEAAVAAGRALVTAARTVDSALQNARVSTQTQNFWNAIRRQLTQLDPAYR